MGLAGRARLNRHLNHGRLGLFAVQLLDDVSLGDDLHLFAIVVGSGPASRGHPHCTDSDSSRQRYESPDHGHTSRIESFVTVTAQQRRRVVCLVTGVSFYGSRCHR
jgi:hypothetical protein